MDDSRSPLKAKPLRTPGQSCEERREALFEDKILGPLIVMAFAIVMTGLEIFRAYTEQPPRPWIYVFISFWALLFLALRLKRYLPELRNLTLGAQGEKAVGQFLERLRQGGYEVFHDIPTAEFNIDHVIVGPAGVFMVETKTWRKRGGARISFDGERLLLEGRSPDRDPLIQCRAQATWLSRQIEEGTGFRASVRPVLLFPGWYIESTQGAHRDIWVLEPKALPAFIEKEPAVLDLAHTRQVSYHLSRYVRTFTA